MPLYILTDLYPSMWAHKPNDIIYQTTEMTDAKLARLFSQYSIVKVENGMAYLYKIRPAAPNEEAVVVGYWDKVEDYA